jgi:hypothetical protein
VMGHDAVLAAIRAIRNAGNYVPRPALVDVRTALRQFNAENNSVAGASGVFWFDETTGGRLGRPPAVVKLAPDAAQPCVVGVGACR